MRLIWWGNRAAGFNMEWILILLKNYLDRIYRIIKIIFFLSHFPDGNEKTQSPSANSF
jgi:hypothetical protein